MTSLGERYSFEVVCIDDGSTDKTAAVLQERARSQPCLRVVTHSTNRGLGAAIETGLQTSTGSLITMVDADGTFAVEDLPKLLDVLAEGHDIVIASAFHPDGVIENVQWFRLFVSLSLSRIYGFLIGSPIHSFSGIFRVYRRSVFDRVSITSSGFSSVTEILLQALDHGMRVTEVPTVLSRRVTDDSKLRFFEEVRNHLRLLLRISAGRLKRRRPATTPTDLDEDAHTSPSDLP